LSNRVIIAKMGKLKEEIVSERISLGRWKMRVNLMIKE